MRNAVRLCSAVNELPERNHVWDRRAQRFLRDMRMLGADNAVIAELAYDILEAVNRKPRVSGGAA